MIFPTDQFSSGESAAASPHVSLVTLSPAREAALYDAGLVNRFNAGDESAFVEIVTRYRVRLSRIAFDVLKNRADADEIIQDTFIRAHRALAKFRGDSSLATWLHCITTNLARNRYWYFFRRCRHSTISIDSFQESGPQISLSSALPTEDQSPSRTAMASEFSTLVTQCLAQMEAPSREILLLRSSLDHSYNRIARDLKINVGTVKSRISRARKILHDLLIEACPEFSRNAQVTAWFEPVRVAA